MNKLDTDYQNLLQDILDNGYRKTDRTGTGTISVFGRQIRHKMGDGFPLLTTKKMAWKTMVTELLWFLRGDTNIKYLVENGCHIWDGDAYKKHLEYIHDVVRLEYEMYGDWYGKKEFIDKIKTDDEFAKKWGELGPIYGAQWRGWKRKSTRDERIVNPGVYDVGIDQIQNLINDLKQTPDSRRLMVNAWNVGEIENMTLPPCHYGFQVYTRELSYNERKDLYFEKNTVGERGASWISGDVEDFMKSTIELMDDYSTPTRAISLMWNQRSVDTFLGLPFNITSYGLLLEILAKEVNMVPDELIGNLGDTHLYLNHIEQAKEQITRTPYELPKLNIKLHFKNEPSFVPEQWLHDDFVIEDYQSHPTIKAPLSN